MEKQNNDIILKNKNRALQIKNHLLIVLLDKPATSCWL